MESFEILITLGYQERVIQLCMIEIVMVFGSLPNYQGRRGRTFFGGFEACQNIKKIINSENVNQNELILVFSKIVSKGLCCDKVWEISIFPSCTPIRGLQADALKVIPLFCTAHILLRITLRHQIR